MDHKIAAMAAAALPSEMFERPAKHRGLAPGCCSAYPDAFGVPCSHQREHPDTICNTCKEAARSRAE